MSNIKEIVRQYANEFFTKEFLLNGDETWDLAAIAWFDEHYPEMTDDDRARFSSLLDRYLPSCRIHAAEQQLKTLDDAGDEIVYDGMTTREFRQKILDLVSSHDFLEARQLLDAYHDWKENQ